MPDTVEGALQRDPAEEEDDQDDVGEGRRHVDDLPRRGDALDHAHVHQDPGDHQGQSDLPVERFGGVDVFGDHEGGAVPEVLGRTADLRGSGV